MQVGARSSGHRGLLPLRLADDDRGVQLLGPLHPPDQSGAPDEVHGLRRLLPARLDEQVSAGSKPSRCALGYPALDVGPSTPPSSAKAGS